MTKQEIREALRLCIEPAKICRMLTKYQTENYYYLFPLAVSDRLVLGMEEDDFMLDGYVIKRITDVTKAEIEDDFFLKIAIAEGVTEQLKMPDVDITDWRSVFTSLQKMGRNVIVESEVIDDDCDFYIGKILKVCANHIWFAHFEADGTWRDEPDKICYSEITTVKFAARYVDGFSKYIEPCPLG